MLPCLHTIQHEAETQVPLSLFNSPTWSTKVFSITWPCDVLVTSRSKQSSHVGWLGVYRKNESPCHVGYRDKWNTPRITFRCLCWTRLITRRYKMLLWTWIHILREETRVPVTSKFLDMNNPQCTTAVTAWLGVHVNRDFSIRSYTIHGYSTIFTVSLFINKKLRYRCTPLHFSFHFLQTALSSFNNFCKYLSLPYNQECHS